MQTEHITAPPTVLVEAVNVTKSYRAGSRDFEILHGVSLEVRAGEMCAVMGPSGSGKSTLLYTLAGLEAPTTGVVSLLGQQTRDLSRTQLAKLPAPTLASSSRATTWSPHSPHTKTWRCPSGCAGSGRRPTRSGRAWRPSDSPNSLAPAQW